MVIVTDGGVGFIGTLLGEGGEGLLELGGEGLVILLFVGGGEGLVIFELGLTTLELGGEGLVTFELGGGGLVTLVLGRGGLVTLALGGGGLTLGADTVFVMVGFGVDNCDDPLLLSVCSLVDDAGGLLSLLGRLVLRGVAGCWSLK